jgi:hypothetical protein
MIIDVSNNTYEEPIELWIAQRNHHFDFAWITYIAI